MGLKDVPAFSRPARLIAAAGLIWSMAAIGFAQPESKPSPQAKGAEQATRPLTPLAHVELAGAGPVPVVLIPGLCCDWTVFRTFMDRNKDRYTMYAVTLPGFGDSAAPPDTADPTDGAWLNNAERAVVGLIEERKLDKPLIVGHSMGAHLAMRLAAIEGDKIRGAIAIDGMPAFPISAPGQAMTIDDRRKLAGMMAQNLKAAPADQWAAQQRQWFSSMVQDKQRAVEIAEMGTKIPRDTTVRYLTELMAADATDRIKGAKPPILVIAAITDEDSPQAPRDKVRPVWDSIQKSCPNLQIVFFENTRHFVMDDSPAELDHAVADFLAGKPVQGKKAPPETPK